MLSFGSRDKFGVSSGLKNVNYGLDRIKNPGYLKSGQRAWVVRTGGGSRDQRYRAILKFAAPYFSRFHKKYFNSNIYKSAFNWKYAVTKKECIFFYFSGNDPFRLPVFYRLPVSTGSDNASPEETPTGFPEESAPLTITAESREMPVEYISISPIEDFATDSRNNITGTTLRNITGYSNLPNRTRLEFFVFNKDSNRLAGDMHGLIPVCAIENSSQTTFSYLLDMKEQPPGHYRVDIRSGYTRATADFSIISREPSDLDQYQPGTEFYHRETAHHHRHRESP